MAITKQMNIKNRTYYFYNDFIKLFVFCPNMLKLDKKIFKGININKRICYKKRKIQD